MHPTGFNNIQMTLTVGMLFEWCSNISIWAMQPAVACRIALKQLTFASSTPLTSSNLVLLSSCGFMSGLCKMPFPRPRSSNKRANARNDQKGNSQRPHSSPQLRFECWFCLHHVNGVLWSYQAQLLRHCWPQQHLHRQKCLQTPLRLGLLSQCCFQKMHCYTAVCMQHIVLSEMHCCTTVCMQHIVEGQPASCPVQQQNNQTERTTKHLVQTIAL